jgi:hypothetical protein
MLVIPTWVFCDGFLASELATWDEVREQRAIIARGSLVDAIKSISDMARASPYRHQVMSWFCRKISAMEPSTDRDTVAVNLLSMSKVLEARGFGQGRPSIALKHNQRERPQQDGWWRRRLGPAGT